MAATRDTSMKDATPFMGFVDNNPSTTPLDAEYDQLLFPIDLHDGGFSNDWNSSLFPPMHNPTLPPPDSNFASAIAPGSGSLYTAFTDDDYLSRYTNQDSSPEFQSPPLSSPVQIPSSPHSVHTDSGLPPDFVAYKDPHYYPFSSPSFNGLCLDRSPSADVVFPDNASPTLAPSDLLLRHPAAHPTDMAGCAHLAQHQGQYQQQSQMPQQQQTPPPWAMQLWDIPRTNPVDMTAPRYTQPMDHPSTLDIASLSSFLGQQPQTYAAPQNRPFSFAAPRDISLPRPNVGVFQPASAPSRSSTIRPLRSTRAYSQRSASETGMGMIAGEIVKPDPDATVRKKKRLSINLDSQGSDGVPDSPRSSVDRGYESPAPQKSELPKPPKLAPSTWQLFFTDWIQRHQMSGDRKLNVAQAAREAGVAYASLSPNEKEPYKRRSQAAKEARERELATWQRTLKPEDIKRENAFRAAQRRAGKSRKGNIKDPNAPKKPLSAYFMFLQHIRANPRLVMEIFGEQRETTAQSVLAAKKWREMTDEDRKPFLAQAEKEKLDYEAARRLYEDNPPGIETTISFNETFQPSPSGGTTFIIGHPQSFAGPSSAPLRGRDLTPESELDSEGFVTDPGDQRRWSRSRF